MDVFASSVCNNTFSYSYYHRILMIIIAFCLAFLLCCNTCVLFRKKKDILNHINYPSDDNQGKNRAQQVDPRTDNRLYYQNNINPYY